MKQPAKSYEKNTLSVFGPFFLNTSPWKKKQILLVSTPKPTNPKHNHNRKTTFRDRKKPHKKTHSSTKIPPSDSSGPDRTR